MKDRDPLSDLLKTWGHQPPPVEGFNRAVWARVGNQENTAEASAVRMIGRLFHLADNQLRWAMPLAASVLIVLSVVLGSSAALAYDSLTKDQRMAGVYARSIDPLQMMARDQQR